MRLGTRLFFAILVVPFISLSGRGNAQSSFPALAPDAPTSLSATVAGSTVTFDWLPPTGQPITGYSLEAALTSGGPIIASALVPGPPLVVPNVPNGTYFVQVRAVNADGAGPASNEVMATVGPPQCPTPPAAPTNLAAAVTGSLVALEWQASTGGCAATHYVLQAGSAPTLSDLATVTLGSSTTMSARAPAGRYFVRIVGINARGLSAPSNEVEFTVGPSCTVPGAPLNFAVNVTGTTAFFLWSPPTSGGTPDDYLLEAGSTPESSELAIVPLRGLSFSSPVPPGSYFLRMRARNACGPGPASETRLLSVVCTPPGTPAPPTASVFGSSATISWTAISGATQYRLEVGTAAGASNVSAQTVGNTSAQLTGLQPGTYFMRVRALNTCGSSPSTADSMFAINSPPPAATCGGVAAPPTVTCINGGQLGAPTARCRDGAWSCSQNRSGTCSSHGGVSCWVCPGPLC